MQQERKLPNRIIALVLFLIATSILYYLPENIGSIICLYMVSLGYLCMGW